MYKDFTKRIFDVTAALLGLIFVSPIFIGVTAGLYFANNGKPFFFQKRPGKGEKLFKIIKFKTMNDKKDDNGNLLPDSERLTSIGSFVRKTSFDEIPQLINVVKGDMSLIGPRPLLPDYLPFYSRIQKKRHNMKPGITGWAQVNGRNSVSWDDKFEMDVWYVEHASFGLDLKIFFMTFVKIFKTSDISANEHATMPRFDKKDIQ